MVIHPHSLKLSLHDLYLNEIVLLLVAVGDRTGRDKYHMVPFILWTLSFPLRTPLLVPRWVWTFTGHNSRSIKRGHSCIGAFSPFA